MRGDKVRREERKQDKMKGEKKREETRSRNKIS